MKKIKLIIIVLAVMTIKPQILLSQKIVCDSLVISMMSVQEYNDKYIPMFKLDENVSDSLMYMLHVNTYIDIEGNTSDTIMLQTERFLGVMPAIIKIYNDTNVFYDTITRIARLAVQQPIPVKTYGLKNFKCEIKYAVMSIIVEYFFGNFSFDNYPKLIFFQTDFGGNLLPNPIKRDIIYKSIYFKDIPDNFLSFSSFNPNNHDNTLDITFIDKNLYFFKNYETDKLNFNIYFPDTISMNRFDLNKDDFFENISKLNYYENKTIDIIMAYWTNAKKTAAFGKGFNNYIFCDTSFISGVSLTHEILHILYPIKTDKQEGQFFIGESVIEWLANYLIYGNFDMNRANRDKFNSKDRKSLYSLNRNDSNSWYLIYNWGADCIQQLANKTDSEKLFQTIINFLKHYKYQTVSYKQFLDWLYNIFPKEYIDNLNENVKHEFN
ncbi:MAG: hypothetical protein LBS69_06940 [Prevotellaceae bacterium]|jgi:hypothetical protein|nr:hypothetical protein [Prevotellaceae bacterium]